MTEEYWRSYMKKKEITDKNIFVTGVRDVLRQEAIKNKHPDELHGICKTDNNYWRHYRASTKLTIDELAMMICKDTGCDLAYCQMQMHKPKLGRKQAFRDCSNEFSDFRNCFLREKRLFKSLVSKEDQEDPNAIPNYLEKVFLQKEKDKVKRKMMGDDIDIQDKVENFEDSSNVQFVDTSKFDKKMEEKYM
ncbi:unnamed protein product [Moneuplotes crassus]|uniref:Uncharacterized protein n=1 Tax=Euplotes crassus TaxID=5936 RepID=A0AAD2D552_EUPCR|nr:unnamed protein product [Moneuplotes crassus]